MEKKKDSYGQKILSHFQGEDSYEFVEREDGFIELTRWSDSYFSKYKTWPIWQKEAIKFVKGRILDIGCGAGRVGLYLQEKNLEIVSIDNSPMAIKVCKKRGLKKAMVRSIEELKKFSQNSFDTIILFGNNFGLLGSLEKARYLLKEMYRITSSDSIIIAESKNPYKIKGTIHQAYYKSNGENGKFPGQSKIRVSFKGYIGEWMDFLLVSKEEMKEIVNRTGWKIEKFIDSGNEIYIAILRKKIIF